MTIEIRQGDALTVLRTMPSDSVHCVVTSPPYFSLRDYGTGLWEGGDPACDHLAPLGGGFNASGLANYDNGLNAGTIAHKVINRRKQFRDVCSKCGARRIDQQIGLEPTPEEWCARLVEVFREVRRVLRPDGTLWLNIGDSHRDKQLVGQPWMLAFALRADGWWLRSEIIWAKPNPMPESVRDRPTKAHEQVFLLTKSSLYFYDAEAVRESLSDVSLAQIEASQRAPASERLTGKGLCSSGQVGSHVNGRGDAAGLLARKGQASRGHAMNSAGRNLRSVWTIATDPLPSVEIDGEKYDHFASFPVELARRCIRAGTSAKGCCPACGAPWARVVEETGYTKHRPSAGDDPRSRNEDAFRKANGSAGWKGNNLLKNPLRTIGWRPTCSCAPADPVPATALDPFFGSGRTGIACDQLQRNCIGIELNPEYVKMARAQIERARARRMIGDVTGRTSVDVNQMELFA